MAAEFTYLEKEDILLMKYHGVTTPEHQVNLFRTIHEVYGAGPYVNSVSDLTNLTGSTITGADMFQQAAQIDRDLEAQDKTVKQAIYVPSDFSFGLSRMYMGFAEISNRMEVKLFEDLQEAVDWVGLSADANKLFVSDNWHYVD